MAKYKITYKNPTDEVKKCILFGYNDAFSKENFGNPTDVIIEYDIPNKPTVAFNINNWEFKSENINQLEINFTISHTDINSKRYFFQWGLKHLGKYINEKEIRLNGSVIELIVDNDTYITFPLLPKTEFEITFNTVYEK